MVSKEPSSSMFRAMLGFASTTDTRGTHRCRGPLTRMTKGVGKAGPMREGASPSEVV